MAGVLVAPLQAVKLLVEIDGVRWECCNNTGGFNRGKERKTLKLWTTVVTFKVEGWVILRVVSQ